MRRFIPDTKEKEEINKIPNFEKQVEMVHMY